MADAITVSSPISGSDRTMTLETGQLAWQADGAVVIKVGKTTVLVTATASRKVREGQDFFPLTVDVEERMYAAGKIPGSFFRREGRAGDQAILTARLTDRPLRPSFPDGFRNEVHVVAVVMGADLENPHDVLVINAASAALMISGIPFDGPIGAVRLAYSAEGKWIPHPTYQEGDESTFELVVAGRALSEDPSAEIAIMMVEAGGTEHAWQFYEDGAPKVTEAVVAEGLEAAKTWIRESIELQRELVKAAGGKRPTIAFELFVDYAPEVAERVEAVGASLIASANSILTKTERNLALGEAADQIVAQLAGEFDGREREIRAAVRSITKTLVRRRIVEEGIRMDGRTPTELRKVTSAVGILPTAHGSGLFERGMTQVLNVTTLGMPRMNQLIDSLGVDSTKRYMHHYNFPPF
jgi:polyribonucleotide nucleotidyltransferase